MQADHYRKVELQSSADLNYLYTNTVALSRQKLDLHFPPSANGDPNNPDPMKERVKELVDEVCILRDNRAFVVERADEAVGSSLDRPSPMHLTPSALMGSISTHQQRPTPQATRAMRFHFSPPSQPQRRSNTNHTTRLWHPV
jgi:kinetochor protein Mis14/NSL1